MNRNKFLWANHLLFAYVLYLHWCESSFTHTHTVCACVWDLGKYIHTSWRLWAQAHFLKWWLNPPPTPGSWLWCNPSAKRETSRDTPPKPGRRWSTYKERPTAGAPSPPKGFLGIRRDPQAMELLATGPEVNMSQWSKLDGALRHNFLQFLINVIATDLRGCYLP